MQAHHTRQRWTLLFVATILLSACAGPGSQTIGILSLSPAHDYVIDELKAHLADEGYTDVEWVYAGAAGSMDALTPLAEELVAADVDVIYTMTTPAALAALTATDSIPIVFNAVGDPVASGIVANLVQPGGNATGLKAGGFFPKQPSYLLSLVPDATHAVLLSDPTDGAAVASVAPMQSTLDALGIDHTLVEVSTEEELREAMAALPDTDGIIVSPHSFFVSNASTVVGLVEELGLPTVAGSDMHTLGYLAAYGPTFSQMTIQIVPTLIEVLKGDDPGDIPVINADFNLRINTDAATRLGFEVPQAAISEAVELFSSSG